MPINMGVFTRPDSKYFWLFLERKGRVGVKERTHVLAGDHNRALAEEVYRKRMREVAEIAHFAPARFHHREDGSGWCYIYFVSDGELIKIGRALNVLTRLRTMQTSHAKPLTILATFGAHRSIEGVLHQRFRKLRVTREWFRPNRELLDLIEQVKSGRDIVTGLVNFAQSLPAHGECASE